MSRLVVFAFVCGVVAAAPLAVGPVLAGEGAPGEEKQQEMPKLASDEEVAEALAQFKQDWKARGIPRDDVVSERNWAMKKIAPLQHPDIVKALAKITKHSNKDLRTLALIYLGDQLLHPYLAAKPILVAMRKYKRDPALLLTGLQSLCLLKYLGARKEIAALLKHKEFSVKKMAIATVGEIKDIRMLREILRLLGVDIDAVSTQRDTRKKDRSKSAGTENNGKKETVDAGYSWDGVDIFVPIGEDPEKMVKEAQERSRREAEAAARGTSTPTDSPGSGASAPDAPQRARGARHRGAAELIPIILSTLKKLTGVKFNHPASIKAWLAVNAAAVRTEQRSLDKEEKAQKEVRD